MTPWARTILLTAIVVAAPRAAAGAQVVSLELREAVSSNPISGAVVRLMSDKAVVAQALTNASGRAGLQAPREGTYRVRVNRIGYAALTSDPISVKAEEPFVLDLKMSAVVIVLPALEARTKSECGQLNENALAGVIWEQVRTALAANVVTQRDEVVPVRVREFRRDLTTDAQVNNDVIVSDAVLRGKPYAAPEAKTLISKGFATLVNDEMTFSAPDAELFLSDEFAESHCFKAVAGSTDSIVGLAFEPTPRRRQSDVRGTLWMNRATSELRFIEFAYVNLPVQLRELGLGGRVDFERLSNGAWIINYWYIRMPRMAEPPQDYRGKVRSVPHLAGFVEVGGRAEPSLGNGILRATIRGAIFDSTTNSPLAGAFVTLAGHSDSVATDADGRYVLVSREGGSQKLVVIHPKLGLIDDGSTRDLVLSVGETVTATFSVPAPRRFAAEFCGAGPAQSGVIGFASSKAGPVEGLDLSAGWMRGTGAPEEERSQSGPRGLFLFCDLPANQSIKLKILTPTAASAEKEVTLKPGEYRWIDLAPPGGLPNPIRTPSDRPR